MFKFTVNGMQRKVDVASNNMPLLWVLRDSLDLKGTKYGCGGGFCGACTVHMDGVPIRSCQYPVAAIEGRDITTIEGLSDDANHPLQKAWIAEDVPQCGYCQSGQLMTAAAFLESGGPVNDKTITEAMAGNVCRCGTYSRIKKAIKRAANEMKVK